MSSIRRRGLQIDDPLGPERPSPPAEPDAQSAAPPGPSPTQDGRPPNATTDGSAPARSDPQPAGRKAAVYRPAAAETEQSAATGLSAQVNGDAWREWTGPTGVGSFRLPHELLLELGDTARELQLPVGMLVAAAITQLLDQPPDTIAALVDRAEDARIQGRRIARRRHTERASR